MITSESGASGSYSAPSYTMKSARNLSRMRANYQTRRYRGDSGPPGRRRIPVGTHASLSGLLPSANQNLIRGLSLIPDANMSVGAETRGFGSNTAVYYNPNQPRSAMPGVLAHELEHVSQRRYLGGVPAGAFGLVSAAVGSVTRQPQSQMYNQYAEPAAYYLAGWGTTRTQLSQVSPWLRPFYSQVLR